MSQQGSVVVRQLTAATQARKLPSRDLEALGERIAELSAQIQAATYQLLVMLRDFDNRGGWNTGFRSCAHWLNWRTGLDLGAAREVRVAHALSDLPRLSAAMERGEVSFSKVRALTRVATAASEDELLVFAKAGTAAHIEKLVRAWRRVDRLAEAEDECRRHASRHLHIRTDEDGMVVIQARLPAETGAVLRRALDAAGALLYDSARRQRDEPGADDTAEQRRADALGVVAEHALSRGLDTGSRGDRYQVVVHVDAETLAENSGAGQSVLEDGTRVSAEMSRRLACDCALVVMRHDASGRALDVGRKKRSISPALRRALEHRDHGCRFPGCGLRLCDAHHVEHWADGGPTKLGNLILLCRRHHRTVHEEGMRVSVLPNGEIRFTRRDGRQLLAAPPLPALAERGARPLVARLAEHVAAVDPAASLPSWDGGPFDLSWAVESFRSIGDRR